MVSLMGATVFQYAQKLHRQLLLELIGLSLQLICYDCLQANLMGLQARSAEQVHVPCRL